MADDTKVLLAIVGRALSPDAATNDRLPMHFRTSARGGGVPVALPSSGVFVTDVGVASMSSPPVTVVAKRVL